MNEERNPYIKVGAHVRHNGNAWVICRRDGSQLYGGWSTKKAAEKFLAEVISDFEPATQ